MNEAVFFFDSGVGGLPYCAAFSRRNPCIPVIYIADNRHFPYGSKSKEELEGLMCAAIDELAALFEARLVVIACNTASVSALPKLRDSFPGIRFVGTVPAIKPAALREGAAGVLGTERTIADPYLRRLREDAERERGGPCRLIYRAAPELVRFAEHAFWTAGEREKECITKPYIDYFRERGVRAVVLGCTHFLLLAESFRRNMHSDMRLFDSIEGVRAQIERVYPVLPPPPPSDAARKRRARFAGHILLTGDCVDAKWQSAAAFFNMKLETLAQAAEKARI